MLSKFIMLGAFIMAFGVSSAAQAEEKLMVLWPKQRASHQVTMEEQAAAYKARGHDYVNHTYETGGEVTMGAPDLFSVGSDVEPVPINIGEVVQMIDGGEVKASETTPK